MDTTILPTHLIVNGQLVAASMVIPASSVVDASVGAAAAISASKVQQQEAYTYAQAGTAVTATIPLFVARGAGTLQSIKAGSIVACIGAATITIDLKKNGTTVLSAVIQLDNGNTARVVEVGTITTAPYVANDFFELVVTATAGGGTLGTGLLVAVVTREAAD